MRKTYGVNKTVGEYQILELIRPNGKSVKLMEGTHLYLSETPYSDYYECGNRGDNSSIPKDYIDMKNETLLTNDEHKNAIQQEHTIGYQDDTMHPAWQDNGFRFVEEIPLNWDYDIYENKIQTKSGEAVSELTQGGGAEEIRYGNGKYWVVTNTNQFYAMDDQFNQIVPLMALPWSGYQITHYGVLTVGKVDLGDGDDGGNYLYLYDESGSPRRISDVPISRMNPKVKGFLVWCDNQCINLCIGRSVYLGS